MRARAIQARWTAYEGGSIESGEHAKDLDAVNSFLPPVIYFGDIATEDSSYGIQ